MNRITKKKLIEILQNAIVAYDFELEQQGYDTEEELHTVLLNEFGMTEEEYQYIVRR